MKRTILGLLAGSILIAGGSFAAAQDAQIKDGNNPAPNPAPMAPAAHGAEMPSKIIDGNNAAPTYPAAASEAASSSMAPGSAAAPRTTQHASHHKTRAHVN
jgi:hypothetical protein